MAPERRTSSASAPPGHLVDVGLLVRGLRFDGRWCVGTFDRRLGLCLSEELLGSAAALLVEDAGAAHHDVNGGAFSHEAVHIR